MPLKVNVPTGHKDWKLTKCPECGAQCWELPLAEVSQGAGSKRTLHHVRFKEGSERKMNDDEKCCCGNCLHHRPSWETGHLSGWHCDNFMADAYGCDTEYDDGEECPDFESKR